jgi:arginine-tRNA-protein transferase
VRVVADQFVPNASQRKLLRRNEDLEVTACRPWATDEQFRLLRRYLAVRHPGGGMAGMDEGDYADMVMPTWSSTARSIHSSSNIANRARPGAAAA